MTTEREARAREVLASAYEKATSGPHNQDKRFHAANVRVMDKRDYADWKDRAAISAMLAFATEEPTRSDAVGEAAIPEGMKPWAGGQDAPVDWDGGTVLLRKGHKRAVTDQSPSRWKHSKNETIRKADYDIIAYTPKPNAPTTVEDDVERARQMLDDRGIGPDTVHGPYVGHEDIVQVVAAAIALPSPDVLAERDRLREALGPFANVHIPENWGDDWPREVTLPAKDFRSARAALAASPSPAHQEQK